MCRTLPINILWDSSHIWGLMAYRAIKTQKLPCRLIKAKDIGHLLASPETKSTYPMLLIVPGGNARLKANALGPKGLESIRSFVACGGIYLGLCGGAGLALQHATPSLGLNLCPWERKPYLDRLQHLASGHVLAQITPNGLSPSIFHNQSIALPVWWPGRFSHNDNPNVTILAKAQRQGDDFWLGDLELKTIPDNFFHIWQEEYGVNLSADFLENTPLIISGQYHLGQYVLSYSHLETPASPEANIFLAHLFDQLINIKINAHIPAWDLSQRPRYLPNDNDLSPLITTLKIVRDLFSLGVEQHLFFQRTPWLYGWRNGVAGAQLNSLHTAIFTLLDQPISLAAKNYWQTVKPEFRRDLDLFWHSATENLLTTRVAKALDQGLPPMISQQDLKNRSRAIFGSPLDGGGILAKLLDVIEEMIFLAQEGI